MNGACYFTSQNSLLSSSGLTGDPWTKVIPLVKRNLQRIVDDDGRGIFYYQLGEVGLSAHVLEDGAGVLLGAPGLQQWTGSVSRVREVSGGDVGGARRAWSYPESDVFAPSLQSQWSDYFGYSVGSGYFGSAMYMVAGSPRHDLTGKVSLFSLGKDQQVQVHWEASGPQVGAYFGSAVAVGDVNADGKSELFVGAPLYSSPGQVIESGLVVIYSLRSDKLYLEESGRLVGSSQHWSRFGSALLVVGDLDRDGFSDLAVGAPYEADGNGAVYIYRGSAEGLLTSASQRVSASSVGPNLKGFGISISRGADVDGNGYSDMAVGAYLGEGSAVVLRTRPVMKLELDLLTDYEILTEAGMTFEVNCCIQYNGYYLLDTVDMTLRGKVDRGLSTARAIFLASGGAESTSEVTLERGRSSCFTSAVKLVEQIEDLTHPLEVTFEGKVNYADPGCKKCGVIGPGSSTRSRVFLPLALGCGPDGVCEPDLQLALTWKDTNQLTLGSGSTVTLAIEVSVMGTEPAYLGGVKVDLPTGLVARSPLPYACALIDQKDVTCSLHSPMSVGEKLLLEITLEESGGDLKVGETVLEVTGYASWIADVKQEIVLTLTEDVEVELRGWVEDDVVYYSSEPNPPAVVSLLTYQVINKGATHVDEVRLDIWLPVTYDGLDFAEVAQQNMFVGGMIECSASPDPASILPESPTTTPPHSTAFTLACGQLNLVGCVRMTCRLWQVELAPMVTLEVAYNITRLAEKFGANFSLSLHTSAAATVDDPLPLYYTESGVWLTLASASWLPPTQPTPAWIYVVSVFSGLILLAIIVVAMVKLGFFKRKRPVENSPAAEQDLEGRRECGEEEECGEEGAVPLTQEENTERMDGEEEEESER